MPGQRAPEAERRRQILDAAYRVAVERGLEGLTGREVAQAAGLSTGLVFFYYGNTEMLRLALLDDLIVWLVEREASELQAEATLREQLEVEIGLQQEDRDRVGLFLEYWVFGMRSPEMRGRLRKALIGYRASFAEGARQLLAVQASDAGEAPVTSLAALAVSLVMGAALQDLLDPSWYAREQPLDGLLVLTQGAEHGRAR